ncbi:MAG: MFS transporter [Chitinophagaceae bacterium]|nr:MFS transporter [Rubrivivax sp.]
MFALVDRQILVLLAEPIRKHLALSDLQLGLLQGTGIAIFAALATYPLGWLADRFDRRVVLMGCVAVWSTAVVACGFAQTFEQLLLASALVGAGEAGMVPLVFSMIPDIFDARRRQMANSFYVVAGMTGGALGLAICGQIIGAVEVFRPDLPTVLSGLEGWRLSFFTAALPAPLMMLLLATIRLDRNVGQAGSATAPHVSPPLLPHLRRYPQTFASFYAGTSLSLFGYAAVSGWIVIILTRDYGQTPQQVGSILGTVGLVATLLGFFVSTIGLRRLATKTGLGFPLITMWAANLGVFCTYIALALSSSALHVYVLQGMSTFLLILANMMYPSALQGLAPSAMRARAVAIQFVLSAMAGAAATPLVGLISDQLKGVANGTMLAAVGVGAPCLLAGALLLRWCQRNHYEKTAKDSFDSDAAAAGAAQGRLAPQSAKAA